MGSTGHPTLTHDAASRPFGRGLQTGDAPTAVLAIRPLSVAESRIAAAHLESPRAGAVLTGTALAFSGWIIGADAPVARIEILHRQRVVQRGLVQLSRPDVAIAQPGKAWAGNSGFYCSLGLVGLPPVATLRVRAVWADGSSEPIREVEVRHRPVQWGGDEGLACVLLQSMGRMGTTWTMRLLAGHPQIVVDPEYPHEARPAQYLSHLLSVLGQPADVQESVDQQNFFVDPQRVGRNPFFAANTPGYHWFATEFAHGLADFCGRSIENFYRHLAAGQGKTDVRCFVEKVNDAVDHPFIHGFREVCGNLREIFLVRDLRDVLCSAKAFNDRRGVKSFGEEQVDTFEQFAAILGIQGKLLRKAWLERRDTALLLRYEDLLSDPRAQLGRLLEHLRLDRADCTIDSMLEHAQRRSGLMARHATSSNALASIGRWRTDLPSPVRESCTEDYDPYLAEFGYL